MLHFEVAFILFIFGLIFGSFATMASYRFVHGGSFLTRSQCPKCGHKLGILDLIPIISFIIQKGKCRYCHTAISLRYPLIELTTAIMFFIIGLKTELGFIQVLLCLLSICLVILIATDFEAYFIPDLLQFVMAVIGVLYAFFNHYELIHVWMLPIMCYGIGWVLMKGFRLVMKKDGLGMGDVKFFGVAGFYLKVEALASFFFISGIVGVIIALIWRLLGKGEEFPFGPALAFSLFTCLVFPDATNITNFMK
jgi:prepilin signal peptidase PulO-like enzyme (type II secretory pathway)